MSDTSTASVADPGPPPPAPPGAPRQDNGFFAWVRGLGIVRAQGWAGGVCGGLAARVGIDPIIVRGVFVVAALIGFPALLVYAVLWALLPDLEGRIPAQQVGRGQLEPVMIAIGIVALLGLVPTVPWLWSAITWPITGGVGSTFTGIGGVLGGLFVAALVCGVIGLIAWLAVRATHNSRGATTPDPRTASADPAATSAPTASPLSATAAGTDAAAAASGERVAVASPLEPPAPDAPERDAPGPGAPPTDVPPTVEGEAASDAAIAAWRVRHAEWREQHDAWLRQQTDADQRARDRARLEREAHGRAFATEAEARRAERRRTAPRTGALYVLTVVGIALVAASLTALGFPNEPFVVPAALLVAALVGGVGMAVAGIARRRSGFLAFGTILLLTGGLVSGFFNATGPVLWGGQSIDSATSDTRTFVQPFGDMTITTLPLSDDGAIDAGTITLRKGVGDTRIFVQPGTTLRLDATLGRGTLTVEHISSRASAQPVETVPATGAAADGRHFRGTYDNPIEGAKGATLAPITITQAAGDVHVVIQDER